METLKSPDSHWSGLVLLSTALFAWLVFAASTTGRSYPWSDEWSMARFACSGKPVTFHWLWAQHGDHRIPVQKLLQGGMLRLSALDTRPLVLLNAALAFAGTLFVLAGVRRWRGRSLPGDASIPLLLLMPAAPPFVWSFQCQFLSSTLLVLAWGSCILFSTRADATGASWWWLAAAACSMLLAAAGMNGVIAALVLSSALVLGILRGDTRILRRFRVAALLFSGTAILGCLVIRATWRPSGASLVLPSASPFGLAWTTAYNFGSLVVGQGLARPASRPGLPLLGLLGVLCLLGVGAAALRVRKVLGSSRAVDAAALAILSVVLAAALILGGVALGRGGNGVPGAQGHYSYLCLPIPIMAWVSFSASAPTRMVSGVGALLVVLLCSPVVGSVRWSLDHARGSRIAAARFFGDLAAGLSPEEVAERNVLAVFHTDTPNTRANLAEGIRCAKRAAFPPYLLAGDGRKQQE